MFAMSKPAAVALALAALAACGGGGGGGSGAGSGGGGGGNGQGTATAPTITAQPASQTVGAGGTANFTIAATGNGTLSYQWSAHSDNVNGVISGATTPTVSVAANAGTAGDYYCVITNTLNGTTTTLQSAHGTLTVVPATVSTAITADNAVLPNTHGLVASVAAQAGVTYIWAVSNGSITAGQGTVQISYTSGNLGPLQITVTVSSPSGGTGTGVKNVVVATAVPSVSIFAQSSVLPGASGVLASTPATVGATYAWSLQSGTASAASTGSTATDTLTYSVGATPGSYQISVNVSDPAGSSTVQRTLAVVKGTFVKDVRDMAERSLHTATLLNDGRLLVAGGDAGIPNYYGSSGLPAISPQSNVVATAELFDPVTTTWAMVGSLATARAQHTATRLNDGRVLVMGGLDASGDVLSSTEIYDPSSESWTAGPSMATPRELPSATTLADGRVLVAGGANASGVVGTAEVYDPAANAWSSAGTMVSPRVLHSATLLANGQVLAAGGETQLTGPATSTTELYNPATNSWQAAAPLSAPHSANGAVLLPSGKVLQVGDFSEIYDPVTNSWQPSVPQHLLNRQPPILNGINATTAILLPDGRVLAAGALGISSYAVGGFQSAIYDPVMQLWTEVAVPLAGPDASWGLGGTSGTVTGLQDGRVLADGGTFGFPPATSNSLSVTALYDPTQNSWSAVGSQAHAGYYAASSVLASGQVLVTGGSVLRAELSLTAQSAADLFDPATNTWSPAAPMSVQRQQHTATLLQTGNVLVTGGIYGNTYPAAPFNSAELYDPVSNAWSSAGFMSSPRYQHTASLLGNGMVLVAGGNDFVGTCNCTTFVNSVDLYNPATNSFTPTGALVTARYAHTATTLVNGMVLVAGGFGGVTSSLHSGGAALASAELYNPSTGLWAVTGSMSTARMNHTATLLPSGKVLVAGGSTGTATTASAEVYDSASGTWSTVASMKTPRQSHGAVMLSNGTVLVVGGLNDASSAVIGVGSAEVYDPTANTWKLSGAMVTTRQSFVLNSLSDGRILLNGGLPIASGLPEFYK